MEVLTILEALMTAAGTLLLKYGSYLLACVAALTVATNIIVEVAKRVLPKKLPTDIVVIAVAVALTVTAMLIACSAMEIAIAWTYVIGAVVLGVFVAYAAMFGFDKFKSLWLRVREIVSTE